MRARPVVGPAVLALLAALVSPSATSAERTPSPDHAEAPPSADACITPPAGLTSWWTGDGNVLDRVGGQDATLRGNAAYGTGRVGLAFALDGDGDWVDVADAAAIDAGKSDFTIALWVRFNSIAGEQVLAEKYVQRFDEVPSTGWTVTKLEESSGQSRLRLDAGLAGYFDTEPISLVADAWYHVAARRSGSDFTVFVDGSPVAGGPAAEGWSGDLTSPASLKLGHRGGPSDTPGSQDDSGYFLNGAVDEVQLYVGTALSDAEIAATFEAGAAGVCSTDPLVIDPPLLAFGDVLVGALATSQAVTVTNTGAVAVTVDSISVSGANADDYSIGSQTCTSTALPAGGACAFAVSFTPSATGPRSALLSIGGSAPIVTRSVRLTGTGVLSFTDVAAGGAHTCAILAGGKLACWGWNQVGQAAPPTGTYSAVSASGNHTCGIRTDGTIACWGWNEYGQAAPPTGTFSAVSAGAVHSCAIRANGTLACWGMGDQGQASPPSGAFVAVSAGYLHTCAIRANGTLACWGVDATPPAGAFTAVSAGRSHSCAIRTDGSLACWGDSGDGKATPPAGTYTAVDVGGFHSCAISTDETIACWGSSHRGQASPPAGSFVAVSAGEGHTCAIRTDGTMACWGDNEYDQLGAIFVAPGSAGFGNAVVGVADTREHVVLGNLAQDVATVTSVTITGDHAADFSVASESCTAAPVAPGDACTVGVAFTPTVLGLRKASLVVVGPEPVGTREIPIAGTGVLPPSGVTWGTTYRAGPAYTWNAGNALARTVQSGTQRLHLAYGTYRIGSSWARDTGPYAGVYYTRSTSGSTWSTPKRLNPTSQHATRLGLAAAGSRVYATWVSQTKIVRYSATAPRVLYVRANTNHGASTSWKSAIRLTSTSGRVDYPTIAAYGYDVHVAWTDSVTGSVKVATSRDRGATWKRLSLGSTSLYDRSGRFGLPAVAVAGSTVAVAWLADRYGTIKARVSTNRGVSWGPTVTVGTLSASSVSVAVRGSRIAVAWVTPTEVVVRQRIGGTWGQPVVAAVLEDTPDGPELYAPAVALQESSRIGIAWSEGPTRYDTRYAHVRWAESANGGAAWFATQTLATPASSRRVNDFPSIVWPATSTRYVAWNGWNFNSTTYRLYLRKGSGAPVGPTSVGAAWVPAEGGESPVVRVHSLEPTRPVR